MIRMAQNDCFPNVFSVSCLFLLPNLKLEPLKPRIHGAPATQRRTWARELRSKEHGLLFYHANIQSGLSISCSQLISAIFKTIHVSAHIFEYLCISLTLWVFICRIFTDKAKQRDYGVPVWRALVRISPVAKAPRFFGDLPVCQSGKRPQCRQCIQKLLVKHTLCQLCQ